MLQTTPESANVTIVDTMSDTPEAEWARPHLSVIRLGATAKLGSRTEDGQGDFETVGGFGVGDE